MKLCRNLFAIALALTWIVGCGNNVDDTGSRVFNGQNYVIVGAKENLRSSDNSIGGTGRLAFSNPLASVHSDNHFELKFSLEDDGHLALVSNSNASLAEGISIKFERHGNHLHGHIQIGNQEEVEIKDAALNTLRADQDIHLRFEIHNSHNPAEVMIFHGDEDHFEEDHSILKGMLMSNLEGRGGDKYWGLDIKSAQVTTVAQSAPKVDHDHGHGH